MFFFMKKSLVLSVALALPVLTGCASGGMFYSEKVQVPRNELKSGSACSFLGIGKNNPIRAAQNGGLEKIVASENANYFGIINCTYAYGE